MKELEHVLQRVRIRGQDGIERKLKESIYAVLRVLADAIKKDAPELGCQMSIQELCKRSRKERSTVMAALAEAQRLKLLWRMAPGGGARYATHLNLIHIRLVEASQKSRPFLGSSIVFDDPVKTPKIPSKNATSKNSKMDKTQQIKGSQEVLDIQNLDIQILDREHVLNTPPAPHVLVSTSLGALPAPSTSLSPCPIGAGGCGSGIPVLTESTFKELKIFSDFLEKINASGVKTQFQRRCKKKDQRGPTFMLSWPKNYADLRVVVERAAGLKFEMHADRLLLVDDLDIDSVDLLLAERFEAAIIETSQKNYQALVATGPGWSEEQVRATQRWLAIQFGGDGNATGIKQPHRLPGSLNQKQAGCFVTRLHCVQAGKLIEPAAVEARAGLTRAPASQAQHRGAGGKDNTPSGFDFGRACEMLAKGQPEQIVVAEIADRASARGRGGDHLSYATRTVKNAALRMQK
jgi:RepB DNA-primase from phage plasmid